LSYQVEIGGKADAQLAGLDSAIGAGVERKIQWLADNAAGMVHRRLVGMPEDLAGLCKLAWAITASSIGFILLKSSSAFIAFSTVPKSIVISKQTAAGLSDFRATPGGLP
jgi:hypothetical protein